MKLAAWLFRRSNSHRKCLTSDAMMHHSISRNLPAMEVRHRGQGAFALRNPRIVLPFLLELVFDAHRDGEVDIELAHLGRIVGAVVCHYRIRRDAKDPML